MNNLVTQTVEKYGMLSVGDKVIVALSGGADSRALLDVLYSLKEKYNLTIYAAHLNHNLRGEEAQRDEDFCKILCKNYNIELFVKSVDIKSLAKREKISEELCGRQQRYKFFDGLCDRLGAKLATAHTASDNAETLLFNIARGTSLTGVCAIAPVRGRIIRPLIEVTRAQVEAYCSANGLEYVNDSTNFSDAYTRNKIRRNAVPVLKEINPQFEQAALRLSEQARSVTAFLNAQTEQAISDCETDFGYDSKRLLSLDRALIDNAVVLICKREADISPEQRHIDLIKNILKNGGEISLSENYSAVAKQNTFRIVKKSQLCFEPIRADENMSFQAFDKNYSVKEINQDEFSENCVKLNSDNLTAVFRTRQSGDKFTYPKRKITKPLRKALNEMKIPSEIRDNILVLACENTILWCEHLGASLQGLGNNNSDLALKIEISEAQKK